MNIADEVGLYTGEVRLYDGEIGLYAGEAAGIGAIFPVTGAGN